MLETNTISQFISRYRCIPVGTGTEGNIIRVTVASQASGSDSRLSLITALTRSHGQPEAADSEP